MIDTLEAARAAVQVRRRDGIICPCCDKYAREYRRKLNAGMARALIRLYRAGEPGTWVWYRSFAMGNGEYPKLAWWGLIEADPTRTGWWRITERGADFVRGALWVPRHAWEYDCQFLRWDDERRTTDIVAALGARFDYTELMNGGGA